MKKTIVFNFHKSKGIVASLIRWQTRSQDVNHVSFTFEDNITFESTLLFGARKTINMSQHDIIKKVEVELLVEDVESFRNYAESELDKGYDFKAIIGFLINKKFENENALFCSEYAAKIGDYIEGFPKTNTLISPKEIMNQLIAFNSGKRYEAR